MITWLPISQFRIEDYPASEYGFIVGYWTEYGKAPHQKLCWIVECAIYSNSMGWTAPDGRRLNPSHFDYFQPACQSNSSSAITPSEPLTLALVELRNIVDKFKALLDDPHPGLATWVEMYERRARELVQFLTGNDDATAGSRK